MSIPPPPPPGPPPGPGAVPPPPPQTPAWPSSGTGAPPPSGPPGGAPPYGPKPAGPPSFGGPPPTRAAVAAPTNAGQKLNPLVLVGAIGVFVSLFTEWGTERFFGESFAGSDIPIEFLNDTTPASFDSTPITYLLVPAIAAMLAGMFVAKARWLSIVGAIGATLIGAWYLKAVQAVVDEFDFTSGISDLVGVGTWICIVSGVVGIVGGAVLLRSRPVAAEPPGPPASAELG
jgi:hypothetical protein